MTQDAITLLAESMAAQLDAEQLLGRACQLVVERRRILAAGITCRDPGGAVVAVGAYPHEVQGLVRAQADRGEGPCVESWRSGRPVLVDDVIRRGRARWPDWAEQATAAGAVKACSEPVAAAGRVIATVGTFGSGDQPVGVGSDPVASTVVRVAAAHALGAASRTAAEVRAEQLRHALDSRVRIEQAKGALAVHLGIDTGAAFEWLRSFARSNNRRLHEVAQEVVHELTESGRLPALATEEADTSRRTSLVIAETNGGYRFSGTADYAAADQLQAWLTTANGAAGMTIDLAELEFMDAHCARLLLAAGGTCGTLVLKGARPGVELVLTLLGAAAHQRVRLVRGRA